MKPLAPVWLGAFGVVTCVARAASAQQPLELELQGCSALSESALREHLALELSTLGLVGTGMTLRLRCDAAGVLVELGQGSNREPVQGRVELGDTEPGARERLVSLAASELIAQTTRAPPSEAHTEPATAATTARRSVAPAKPARDTHRQQRPARRSRAELSAAASAALQGEPKATLWGAALGARFVLGARVALVVDARFERGQQALSLADVRWTSWSGFAGVALSGQVAALELSAGLGVRAGWLSLAANALAPNDGARLTAPWGGVAVPLRVTFVGRRLRPFVGTEAGYITLPVRGNVNDGSVLLEERGVWLSGSLGVAVTL